MATGTGTAGANQNGAHPTGPYGTPGEIVSISGPLDINAAVPVVDKDFGDMFVTTAYDLAVRDALRPNLILDQFATEKPSHLTHDGGTKRVFFLDDLAVATTPLLENLDIDAVALTGRSLDLTQREYGNAVTRTALLKGQSMVPFDPIAARKVGYNAGKTMDALAKAAFFGTTLAMKSPSGATITGTIATLAPTLSNGSVGYFSTEVLQEATVMLADKNAEGWGEADEYVAVVTPRAAQHLRAEAGNAGWREVVMRNEGGAGNSIFRGYVGTYEGVHIVVSRNLTAGKALVFGKEAFAKVYPDIEGFGAYPDQIVSPVTDKLRRFASLGWYWLGGYSIFRPQVVVQVTHTSAARPLGGVNAALGATAYAES